MKFFAFSVFFIFITVNGAHASCQWGYVNELNKDIKHASALLSDYSTCRGNCKALETGLNNSIRKMSNASACGGHILTRANGDMINFISSRFRLIQKQKTGSTWTKSATAKPAIEITNQGSNPSIVLDRPAFVEPQKPQIQTSEAVAKTFVYPSQQPVQVAPPASAAKQTRMRISPAAYAALWDNARPARPQRRVQRAVFRQPQPNNHAKQKQLAQQRLIQHRKQAQIQQKKQHQVLARKRLMQNHLNRQRQNRQQLLKKRAVMAQLNRQRHHQRKVAMAQRTRAR